MFNQLLIRTVWALIRQEIIRVCSHHSGVLQKISDGWRIFSACCMKYTQKTCVIDMSLLRFLVRIMHRFHAFFQC